MADDNTTDKKVIIDVQAPQSNAAPDTIPVEPVAAPEEAMTPSEVPVPAAETADSADPATTEQSAPESSPLAPQLGDKTPHHRGAPKGAIAVAVFVALVLASLTVYALKGTNVKTATTPAPQQTATTVKATDVDQTSKDVDTTLDQANDSADLSANDISDATLGL